MSAPFRARNDNVLVKPFQREKTKGGIQLPEGSQDDEDLLQGEVVSIGPGAYSLTGEWIPTTLKVGDVVYLSFRGRPSPVRIDGEKYIICKEEEITGEAVPAHEGNGSA